MRNSMDSGFNEIKELKGRRGIRDRSEEVNFVHNRIKQNNNEDRSNSEPPRSYGSYLPATSRRLKTIREKKIREDAQGSSDEDGELSKSNSQLNESDLDMEIPDSASASVSQTPTPTPLVSSNARRINSETNLNDSKRRLSGFMGNRSKRFCASTSELSFTSHLDTHKSLFSPKNNALSRQSFNSSLYGSNMSLSSTNSRLFMANSPFYNGKTMFGGASAYPKRDINQHKILRTPVQMRPSSSLSNSSNTSGKSDNIVPESNAAKRILEIMNQFSGPLKEARSMGNNINSIIKVPSLVQSRKRYGEEELNLDRSIALSTPSAPYGRPLSGAPSKTRPESPLFNSASAKPLQIPTMSQLLQMKRLQNNTERVREIASRSDSFLNQNHEYKLPSTGDETHSNSTSGASLKMKSNITKNLLRPDKNSANDQLPALPLNLPNIKLPAMKSIPKFDIQLPPLSIISSKPPAPTLIRSSPAMPIVSTISKVPEVHYNFQKAKQILSKKNSFILSKPLQAGDGSVNATSLNHIHEKFILSKPILIDDDEDEEMSIVAKSPVKSSLSTVATDNLFKNLVAQQKSSSWECDSCLTRNDAEKTNCLCCESSKPGSGKATQPPAVSMNSSAPAADDLFMSLAAKQQQSQWECDGCMTKNDVSKDSCACCETPKPGSKPALKSLAPAASFTFGMPAVSTKPAPTNDNLFKNLAAQQKQSQWECESCMTRNDAGKDVCACCTTPRPGAKPQTTVSSSFSFGMKPAADSTAVKSAFSFGMPQATSTSMSDAGFKKIVEKQSASWECSACLTRNESTKMKCVCCEQAKPGSGPATPQFSFGSKTTSSVSLPAPSEVKFSFGMPAAKVDAPVETKKVEESVKVHDEVDKPKPTFSFGMNNVSAVEPLKPSEASAAVSAPSFTFKSPASTASVTASFTMKPAENKEEEKKEAAKPATPMFSFGAPKPAPEPENKITFGTDIKAAEPIASKQHEKVEEVKKPDFGGFKFGADTPSAPTTQAPAPAFGNAINKNGGFSFGGFGAKPAEPASASEPIKTASAALPSATGGFSFGSPSTTPTFGSQPAASPATNSFFGASKPENEAPKTFGSFGGASSPANTTFGMPSAQSAPVFGQSNAPPGAFSFSAKKEEPAQAQQSSMFAFGTKPAASENAPMLFGNANQTNQAQNVTPVFGASSNPSFGSTMTTNNNNESGFGSKMPSFGNTSHPQKRAFEFTPDAPQTKKSDFGGQQQHQQQQTSAAPFQFNAQVNENKPAFNFGATSQPSFNFSSPAANNPQDPQNCFQFGANNGNSTQGIFAFAPATAPPVMQFGSGAQQPHMGATGINTFSAQGTTSSTAANNRKILRAARRTRR